MKNRPNKKLRGLNNNRLACFVSKTYQWDNIKIHLFLTSKTSEIELKISKPRMAWIIRAAKLAPNKKVRLLNHSNSITFVLVVGSNPSGHLQFLCQHKVVNSIGSSVSQLKVYL